jgi:hypothetical protein
MHLIDMYAVDCQHIRSSNEKTVESLFRIRNSVIQIKHSEILVIFEILQNLHPMVRSVEFLIGLTYSYLLRICSECVEILLMHGATVLIHDAVLGRTPLHAAGKDIPNTQISHKSMYITISWEVEYIQDFNLSNMKSSYIFKLIMVTQIASELFYKMRMFPM